jgi:hypothetical protein
MSSSPYIHANQTLRQVKLASGRTVVAERLGEQHYLVWDKGTPLTEIQCVPTGSGRWYCRGSGLKWSDTRGAAIQEGLVRNVKGIRTNRKPLEAWTPLARHAIDAERAKRGER